MVKPRYETVKNSIVNGRCTVNNLRSEIRKEFRSRIHTFRCKQVDAHRCVLSKNVVSNMIKEGISELQASLLADKEAVALLDADSVLKILGEVQQELLCEELHLEAEAYEKEMQRETSALVENLLSTCDVCEKLMPEQSEKNVICQECAVVCFNVGNMSNM